MGICIWCKEESSSRSIEHIIPEALGCPDGFYLKEGDVCKSCNNKLAHLDQAVIDEFDISSFMWDVPRKKNRLPAIDNRGNLIGKYINTKNKAILINMGSRAIEMEGHRVAGYGKSKRNVKAKFEKYGLNARISFSIEFGEGPKFVRGIMKIALSSLAYFIGTKDILLPKYDLIRDYIVNNKGQRKILLTAIENEPYRNQVWAPYVNDDGYAIELRIATVAFFVDLTPNMTIHPVIYEKAMQKFGTKGWNSLPIDNEA